MESVGEFCGDFDNAKGEGQTFVVSVVEESDVGLECICSEDFDDDFAFDFASVSVDVCEGEPEFVAAVPADDVDDEDDDDGVADVKMLWTVLQWRCKRSRLTNAEVQCKQWNGFSLVWDLS